jgi:hypothetical protein
VNACALMVILPVVDDEAVFYHVPFEPSAAPLGGELAVEALPPPRRPVAETIRLRGFTEPVRCRLVDFINCAKQTHAFRDDGGSRVLELGGEPYRVTAAPKGFELKWFEYTFTTAGKPGTPHLLVAQLINDQERYTTITLTVPPGAQYPPPLTGQEKPRKGVMQFCQQPDCFRPDVGGSVYTGRELPLDGKPFLYHYVFYPKTEQMLVTVSSSGWNLAPTDESGAAVAKIWVFEILDRLGDRLPEITPPNKLGRQRRLGMYVTHPWYLLAHYGMPANERQHRRRSLDNAMALMRFCGMNVLEFNVINGADRATAAWYDSRIGYYDMLACSLLEELPPVAAKHGIDIVPVVTSITAPKEGVTGGTNQWGFSVESFQHGGIKGDYPNAFGQPVPDPLRPEVQDWLIRHIREIAEQAKPHDCYTGLGFRVNGKIGLCYVSWEDKSGKETKVRPARAAGYSPWDLSEFRKATGIDVPDDSVAAYAWLQERPEAWDAWLDFRCRRTHALWLRVRDVLREYRPDWTLYVLTDLPSEVPGTNIEWSGSGAKDAEVVTLDLLRAHGFDPRLYKNDDGIVIQRVMMIDADRFWSKWGPPWGSHPGRYKAFHFQPFLPDWYRTPAGAAVEFYHNYWEEPFHPQGEFGPDARGFGLRTATATARGRAFFEPATFSVRQGNVDTMVLLGWERPTLGHEHDLRRFAQAFRALPAVAPRPFDGRVAIVDGPRNEADTLAVAWYADRLGLVNDAPYARTVRITLAKPLPAGRTLRDTATGEALIDADTDERNTFELHLLPYDVRTLTPVSGQ